MKINTQLSSVGCWQMVNGIKKNATPEKIRKRCSIAEQWLLQNEVIESDEFHALMGAVNYLYRTSYTM